MNFKSAIVFSVFVFSVLIINCNYKQKQNKPLEDAPMPEMVGNDRDSHGCIGSAGYTWSELKQDCIRVFEAGTPFTAYGTNKNTSLAAYVIVSADKTKAEVYLPNRSTESGVILAKVKGNASLLFENQEEKIKITSSNSLYLISVNEDSIFSQEKSDPKGLSKFL